MIIIDWQNALVAAALLLAAMALFKSRKPWLSRIRRKAFMTGNEAEFFQRLQKALPAFHIFPQVSFAALMTDDGRLPGKARWNVRARFDRKIADFVICDRGTLQVRAIIELDDRTHRAQADRQRDAMTRAAGYSTIRFSSHPRPSIPEIATRISTVL